MNNKDLYLKNVKEKVEKLNESKLKESLKSDLKSKQQKTINK